MTPQKRLLIISNRYPSGADDMASPFVRDFVLALNEIDIAVDVVTPFYKTTAGDDEFLDESIHRFDWSDGTKVISQLPLYHPATFFKIRRYFKNAYTTAADLLEINSYQAILALWAAPSGITGRKLSEKYNLPYAVWALGSDINNWARLPLIGGIITKVLQSADRLFADGNELALKVQSLSQRSCRFISSFHKVQINMEKPDRPDKQFISVGRIERGKGVFDLLEAFRIFRADFPEWKLCYVGSGRDEDNLKNMIAGYRLEKQVKYCGYLRRDEINRLMIRSAAAIIPSLSDSLPLTFGEAMQIGLPVICSEVGDMPYFIDRYDVGLHYPAGNVEQLAGLMRLMADNDFKFAENCPRVLRELDIKNSARVIGNWIDETGRLKPERRVAYADR